MSRSETTSQIQDISPRLLAYLRALVGEDAEDVLQEVHLASLGRRASATSEGLEAWLFRCARHRALNHLRGERRRRLRETRATELMDRPADRPALRAEQDEASRLRSCLRSLPVRMRELLHLRVVEGAALSRIASLTGIPRSTAALRCREALVLLNRCFHGAPSHDD